MALLTLVFFFFFSPTDSPARARAPHGVARDPLLATGGRLELSGGGTARGKWRPGDPRVGGGGAALWALPPDPRASRAVAGVTVT